MNIKNLKIALIALVVVAVLGSFAFLKIQQVIKKNQIPSTPPIVSGQDSTSTALKKFKDYDEFKAFMSKQNLSASQFGARDAMMLTEGLGATTNVMSDISGKAVSNVMAPAEGGGGQADYSQTNIQVAGVDEADVLKSDGEYFYSLSDNNLYISKVYPATEAKIVSKTTFDSRPTSILISGNRLAVFGSDDRLYLTDMYRSFARRNQFSFLKIYDISDKSAPKLVKSLDLEGNYFTSRLIGSRLYLVANSFNYSIGPDLLRPRILEGDQELAGFNPEIYYFDRPYTAYNFTSVVSIDLNNITDSLKSQMYLVDAVQNVYMSNDNLYLTNTEYLNEQEIQLQVARDLFFSDLPADWQAKISKIEGADTDILSKEEKMMKIQGILEAYVNTLSEEAQNAWEEKFNAKLSERLQQLADELEKTGIYKIAIKDGALTYQSTATVPGTMLNQFSMDEYQGNLRIATTRSRSWLPGGDTNVQESYNNLYVLDSNLQIIGRLEKMALGERLYSARFIGNLGYLVTFKQVDPLFVIDLSNPASPQIKGELKIPGYSAYLHPIDDKTLIGLGVEMVDSGGGRMENKGLKISIFDVSDPQSPKEKFNYVLAGASSNALYDHHAFLYSSTKNLLAIPINDSKDNFNGFAVFKINSDSLELLKKISHSFKEAYSELLRSAYINDNFYTLSSRYLKINSLNDWSELGSIKFDLPQDNIMLPVDLPFSSSPGSPRPLIK